MDNLQTHPEGDRLLVGILVRVSTKRQGERGASTETQRSDCLAYAEREGWTVAVIEEDHDTGTNFDRAGYQRLLSAAKEGRIHGIVVRDLSRFGRGDYGATAREFDEFRAVGCFIASALDRAILQADEHLAERLDVGVKVVVNSYFSAMLAKNVPPNMARRVREGKWVSRPPFGYRMVDAPDGRGRILEPDPERAWAVPIIFQMAADGQSEAALMAFVQQHGLCSRYAGSQTLSRTAIRRMLENSAYAGKVTWNRKGRGRFRSSGKRPESEIVVADGLHRPLVDADTFRHVQARLQQRRTYKTYTKQSVSLLDGIAYCGRCGARMRLTSSTNSNTGRRYTYYSCANHHDRYSCDQPLVSARRVDEQVLAVIQQTFKVSNVTAEAAQEVLVKRRERLVTDSAGLRARLERRQTELTGKLDRLVDESVAEGLSQPRKEAIDRLIEVHERNLEAVQQELRSLRPEEDQLREIDEAIGWLDSCSYGERVFEKWGKEKGILQMRQQIVQVAKRARAYDPAAWQRVARQFIHRVEIEGRLRNGRVNIEWSATAESILQEETRSLKLARTVFRRCAVPQSRR